MADLYTAMVGDDADEAVGDDAPTSPEDEDWAIQKTSVFLTRILFLLYGDDATFPVPELSDNQRETIIKAGQKVLDARALHPERSLHAHYTPLAMDPVLVKAHDVFDREVDKAFGAPRKLTTERQRQEPLFDNYACLT